MWTNDLSLLKRIYLGYLITWLGGGSLFILGLSSGPEHGGALTVAGVTLLGLALIAYIACLVFAFRVQKGMKADGLTTHDPVHIIIAGVIFNPCIVGFWIPLSVMLAARKAQKKMAQPPPPLPSP